MGNLADILKSKKVDRSPEEVAKMMRASAGYDGVERNPDGSFLEIDPKVRARTKVIIPWKMQPVSRDGFTWDDALANLSTRYDDGIPVAFIFGAGGSTLDLDLRELSGRFVYGINWTLKWFEPTMLQIMDDGPLRTQIRERKNREDLSSVLVTSRTLSQRYAKKGGLEGLRKVEFDCRDPHKDPRSFVFPEWPWDPLEHYSNSLGIALQIVHGLGFKKIVLVGFDFGGAHFFGDGRQEGCVNHYGLAGEVKPDLHVKLMALSHVLRQNGCRIAQVGPTKLEWAFEQVSSVREALDNVGA